MKSVTEFIRVIQGAYPDLVVSDARLLGAGGGQYSIVLLVNERLVFRFPRFAEGLASLAHEVRLLRALQGRLPLAIPDPIYASTDPTDPAHAFMGYPLLPGQPLWRDVLQSIAVQKTVAGMAAQLGAFLQALHAVPVTELPGAWPVHDLAVSWAILYSQVREQLFAHMRADAQQSVTEHFEQFLASPERHAFVPAIRHGDFGSSNILWDPDRGAVTAVIDFSSAALGDPAVDLAAVSTYGEPFFTQLLAHYPSTPEMLARAHFYRGTYALQEALYGLRAGDEDTFRAGMAGLT